MVKHLLIVLLSLISTFSYSQYGNEWIDYSQRYVTFPIHQKGLYRISYETIQQSIIPIDAINHNQLQLFGRNKQQPIYVELNGDATFDPGDYILFFADKNDGWNDSSLYLNPQTVASPYINLYNDTINYFLSWSTSTNNLRFTDQLATNYTAYNPGDFVMSLFNQNYTNAYLEGETIQSIISSSFYVAGEGFGLGQFNGVNGYQLNLAATTPFPFTGANAPSCKFIGLVTTTASASVSTPGSPNHHTRFKINNQTVFDETGFGCFQFRADVDFPPSLLTANTPVTWEIVGDLPVATQYQGITHYSIKYPRVPNFNTQNDCDFFAVNSTQNMIRLDMNPIANAPNPIYFSFGTQPKRLIPEVVNGQHVILLPNNTFGKETRVVGYDRSTAFNITQLEPVNGNGYFTNYLSQNIEKAYIIINPAVLNDGANAYKTYRQSISGGNHNVLKVNVEELFLQYGGGVKKHISGIRNFVHQVYAESTDKPVALFLIGKGIANDIVRFNATNWQQNLIPTFGYPSSDLLITSNLPGTTKYAPLVPTGRLSALENQDIFNYLTKMEEYESQQDFTDIYDSPNKDWQKHIVHLVGGTDLNQQAQFNAQMTMMKYTIERDLFAGKVHTIKRDSDDPIPPNQLQSIMNRIEEGVSMMTYYGHHGIGDNGFEINLDDVNNWGNQGKYPLMLVNSCYNGDIFKPGMNSSSEYFVGAQNVGAIGYISSSHTGLHPIVGQYSNRFYLELGRYGYGKTIGEHMVRTINAIPDVNHYQYLAQEFTVTQMLLHGDPAIRINWHPKPEIELTAENVRLFPNTIDLSVDSLELQVVVKNLGQSITDTLIVEIRRNFPGSDMDSVYFIKRPRLDYTDTIRHKMPLQPSISAGLNSFEVKVDIPSMYPEIYDELNNNQIVQQFMINLNGILPVAPYDFAVIPWDTVTLVASTINPLADFNTYRFEIDTTDLFNSPFKRHALVSGLGGVKKVHMNQWNQSFTFTDSTVYFWRVAIDSDTAQWAESSFQYIPGKSGWGQDHFFQFKKNNFNNVVYDRSIRQRTMSPDSVLIRIDSYNDTRLENAWYIEGTMQDYATCGGMPQLHVAVIDPVTIQPWQTNYNGQHPGNDFGNVMGCRGRSEKYFIFWQNDAQSLQNFQNMVLNSVPDGHHLLIWAPVEAMYDQWDALSPSMYSTFAALGSDSIIQGRQNGTFAFYVKKGVHSTMQEKVMNVGVPDGVGAESGFSHASVELFIQSAVDRGREVSTLIGPAFEWKEVFWKQKSLDGINNADTTRLILQPYTWEMQPGTPINLLFTNNDSLQNLQGQINATTYPYLRLTAEYKDSVSFTPAQVDYWHVLYDWVPEAAIDGSNGYYFSHLNDSIFEGQNLAFSVPIRNVWTVPMDSLLVKYWVVDNNNVTHPISYARQDSLRIGGTLHDTVHFTSAGLKGFSSLWMEVNPYINGSLYQKDQPEQLHFNNVLQFPFHVNNDNVNPILDVTFDGRHILNGDIINPKAEIVISLKDENPYLVMNSDADTTLFGIYLTPPNGQMERIPFIKNGEPNMHWTPAENNYKRFKINYPANFTQDGKYRLTVQGSDRSGNLSGDVQYKVDFEVINGSSITHMMNYPNPFSTSTRFVFTLTGTNVPDDIIIQIMTVSGRVVREITEDQLGPIRIGRNVTEYAWDGRDEFGDQLANGVYLYTVKARINGEDIEHRESGADQYFKKSFGKMYLLR